jgi:hypothetical protein
MPFSERPVAQAREKYKLKSVVLIKAYKDFHLFHGAAISRQAQ